MFPGSGIDWLYITGKGSAKIGIGVTDGFAAGMTGPATGKVMQGGLETPAIPAERRGILSRVKTCPLRLVLSPSARLTKESLMRSPNTT